MAKNDKEIRLEKAEGKGEELVIDATDLVLGKVAAFAAKQAIQGKTVILINCEKAFVTGSKKNIIEEYKQRRARGANQGPFFPKLPERIVKRAIRGMLPYKKTQGARAFKRVKCFAGAEGFVANTQVDAKTRSKGLYVEEISKFM